MPKFEITTMIMVENADTNEVLVQNRKKSWKGISFPGGHIEDGESFVDCAIREIKEETGLDVKNLKSCGVIHWMNNKTFDRYIVFLYKTKDFSGELISEMNEGQNFWMSKNELLKLPSENGFDKYLPMFYNGEYNEAFGSWNDNEPWDIVYK